LAGNGNFKVSVFDVTAAFLEGTADCVQYCRLPACMSRTQGDTQERVQIIGNMYGEKQAPKVWNDKLHSILLDMQFRRCPWDACLYMGWFDDQFLMISIHVDDGYLVSSCDEIINTFHAKLLTYIKNESLFRPNEENAIKYTGIDIRGVQETDAQGNNGTKMYLSQKTYITDMILFEESNKCPKIPMNNTTNLRVEVPNPELPSLLPVTGKFRYICDRTRPDILVATGEISTGSQPSNEHYKVAKQTFNYLKCTKDKVLKLGGCNKIVHFAFSDASYITAGNSKSRLGHCQFLGTDSGAIDCTSVNDHSVSHSSMEAEIKALDLLVLAVIHTRNIMEFLDYDLENPTMIFCDNQSAIELCKTLKQTNKSRHIQMRINFIRECINKRLIEIIFVPTAENVADVLTKPLPDVSFHKHIDKIMNGFNGDIDFLLSKKVTYEQVMMSIELRENVMSNITK